MMLTIVCLSDMWHNTVYARSDISVTVCMQTRMCTAVYMPRCSGDDDDFLDDDASGNAYLGFDQASKCKSTEYGHQGRGGKNDAYKSTEFVVCRL